MNCFNNSVASLNMSQTEAELYCQGGWEGYNVRYDRRSLKQPQRRSTGAGIICARKKKNKRAREREREMVVSVLVERVKRREQADMPFADGFTHEEPKVMRVHFCVPAEDRSPNLCWSTCFISWTLDAVILKLVKVNCLLAIGNFYRGDHWEEQRSQGSSCIQKNIPHHRRLTGFCDEMRKKKRAST